MEQLADLKNLTDFKSLLVRLASPEEIRAWSRGEIVKPEHVASAVYFYIGLQTLSSDTKCMGTLLNPNKL